MVSKVADLRSPVFQPLEGLFRRLCRGMQLPLLLRREGKTEGGDAFAKLGKDLIDAPLRDDSSTRLLPIHEATISEPAWGRGPCEEGVLRWHTEQTANHRCCSSQ